MEEFDDTEYKTSPARKIVVVILCLAIAVALIIPFFVSLGMDPQIIAPGPNLINNDVTQIDVS